MCIRALYTEMQSNEKLLEQLVSLETVSSQQQQKLAQLLWESFHGSIDDLGETPEEMAVETEEILAGKYGEFLGKHSYVYVEKSTNQFLGCALVSFFREIPLIIYVSVLPEARGRNLSTTILNQTLQSLASEYEAAYLVVKDGNIPAEKIYDRLGFEAVGNDWDHVLNETTVGREKMNNVQLKPVTQETIDACLALKVMDDQEHFVAPVAKSLAYAYVNQEYCRPFGIYDGEKLVGYVSTIYDPSDGMYCIWHMLIDKEEQGKGYGIAGLERVIAYFQSAPFGKGTSIGLSCDEHNQRALNVYHKLGFKENGEKDDEGEVILIRSL
uniref:N-acetyltransferase domain-containing protein n=1 Tax=Candidatus Enterococcus clewellii TaxID=1834193 RepID=A0A242K495_9ENTE|nr:GNAT family N-acetyltransferase [Enterococcus sp. 9E7_DIV0242]OTP13620.1 hypothetical protein A5888_003098 [Enterococcus sp. 9E7_DIV0242]